MASGLYSTTEEAMGVFEGARPGDACLHDLSHGAAEVVNPSKGFDARTYLARFLASIRASGSRTGLGFGASAPNER